MRQEGLDRLLRSLLVLCFHSSICNFGHLTYLYSSKSQLVDAMRGIRKEKSERESRYSVWFTRISLCEYRNKDDEFMEEIKKSVFKTDIISSVEKNHLVCDYYFCVTTCISVSSFWQIGTFNSLSFPSVKFSLVEISDWTRNIFFYIFFLNRNAREWESRNFKKEITTHSQCLGRFFLVFFFVFFFNVCVYFSVPKISLLNCSI